MTISTYPQIMVYVSEKPALKEDCDTIAVNTINEVKVMLWALAKQAKPEWAMAFLPMGIEPMTNDGMRHADIPANIASEVEKEVLRLDRLTMDSIVTEALNPFYDELASLFATRSNFVELLSNSAKDWGKECEQVV